MESQPASLVAPTAATEKHDQLLDRLNDFRDKVEDMTVAQKTALAPHLESIAPDLLGDRGAHSLKTAAVERLLALDDADTITVLRRDVATLELQTHDMRPFVAERAEAFVEGVRYEVAKGRMSPAALKVIKSVPEADIRIGSWWATRVRGRHGFYNHEHDFAMLEQGIGATTKERDEDFKAKNTSTIPHELFHREFYPAIHNDDLWLEEAMAEHVALSLDTEEMEVLHPDDRTVESGINRDERILTAEMMDGLDVTFLTRAVTSQNLLSREWKQLDDELYQKYGAKGMVTAITQRVRAHEEVLSQGKHSYTDQQINTKAIRAVTTELRTEPWKVTGVQTSRLQRLGARVTALLPIKHH
jgi:hypothetical protein